MPTILIADDDHKITEMLRRTLTPTWSSIPPPERPAVAIARWPSVPRSSTC